MELLVVEMGGRDLEKLIGNSVFSARNLFQSPIIFRVSYLQYFPFQVSVNRMFVYHIFSA